MRNWTEENIDILRAEYDRGGTEAVMSKFGVDRKRANELRRTHLHISLCANRARGHHWTASFAAKMKEWHEQGGVELIEEKTGWTHEYALNAVIRMRQGSVISYNGFKSNDVIDNAIIAAYAKKKRGAVKEITCKYNLDYAWVKHRARDLGVQRGNQNKPWGREEILIVESLVGATTNTIQKELNKRGYYRSGYAIDTKMSIMNLSRAHEEGLTGAEVSRILGVESGAVYRWLKAGLLAGKRGTYTAHRPAEAGNWLVSPVSLRKFIREHRTRYDLRHVQQELFLSILFDNLAQIVIIPNEDEDDEGEGDADG